MRYINSLYIDIDIDIIHHSFSIIDVKNIFYVFLYKFKNMFFNVFYIFMFFVLFYVVFLLLLKHKRTKLQS